MVLGSLEAIAPRFTGKIWPNGRFGVSRVRETPFPFFGQSQSETEETQWRNNAIAVHGLMAVVRFEGKEDVLCDPDLSNVPKSPIRKKRGQGGITRYGRNLISSAAILLERRYGRHLLTFATVTLPAAESSVLQAVSNSWSKIVKQFVKNLTRGLEAKALPSSICGVTEIQEKRLARTGVPALHLHLVFVGRNSRKSSWQVNRKNIRRWWKRAIAPYFPAGTDYSSVENVQQVKKSTSAYLGKYMSKGVAAIGSLVEAGLEDFIPSAWYTISHALRRCVLKAVVRGEECGNFLNWLCHNVMAAWVDYVCPVMAVAKDGSQFGVGYGGRLSSLGLRKVEEIFNWNFDMGSN